IEALFWRAKSSPVVPLVTANPDPNSTASLAEPGTTVLFGGPGQDTGFGSSSGLRGTLGGRLTDGVGIEGNIFGLAKEGKLFTVAARGEDGPVIGVPFFSTVTNIPFGGVPLGEASLNPGNVPSQISVNATTQLWGAEALGLANVACWDHASLVLLGGFRYIR